MAARGCFNCGGFGHQAANCPKAGTPTCYNCGQEGHVSRDCTAETKAKTCYRCGKEGHISRECPDNTTATGGNYSAFNNNASSTNSGTECYRCGKVGHIARACPEAPGGAGGYSGGGGNFGSFGGASQRTWWVLPCIFFGRDSSTHADLQLHLRWCRSLVARLRAGVEVLQLLRLRECSRFH
ncbi:hypothetical protein FKP32DRAFT_1756738 [Trametes sanguinea]|nr:hypothetical protein FKP32DRAFT_1756738 [Trametes sanguinea]